MSSSSSGEPAAPTPLEARAEGGSAPWPSAVSKRATGYAVAVLSLMNLVNYVDRYVLPAVLEDVRRDLRMNDAQAGFALTSFVLVYMLAAPLFGRLGDRGPRRGLLAAGVALWSVATAGAAFARTYAGLLLARSAVGVGEAAYATLSPALVGDYFPARARARVLALFYLAIPVGSALGYVLGGALAQRHGWRAAFLAAGLPGLALAALALTLREPPRGQFDAREGGSVEGAERASLRATLATLARNREYAYAVVGLTLYTFALGGLAQWLPTYLIRVRGMSTESANGTFGAVTVLAGLLGTAAGGAAAEALVGRVRHPYLWLSGVTCLLCAPVSIATFSLQRPGAMWCAVFVAELLAFASTGPLNAVLVNAVPARSRALAMAVSILLSHALGDALSPTLIGLVSDRAGSLRAGVQLVPVAFALGGLVWLYAQRAVPERAEP